MSSKEGGSAFKPRPSRKTDTDLPTIIFKAGLSESLNKLGIDAAWWLKVQMAMYISLLLSYYSEHN
jgi:hypothetical protein